MREREGLIARIRQVRGAGTPADRPGKPPTVNPEPDHLRTLDARITELEQLVQGLQDSVHRESLRHAKRIAELESRLQPAALGKALSADARARGL